jgi:hypothetical protein
VSSSNETIIAAVFQSERFDRQAWPTISPAVSPSDAARDVTWIAAITGVPAGARLYSAHELAAMLRPERWSRLDFYGALYGTPFSLDAPRLVIVARK